MIEIYYLGIDLGGTNIKVGVVNDDYQILATHSVKTNIPRPAVDIAKDMVDASKVACSELGITLKDIERIGIGSPGMVDSKRGIIEFAGNLGFTDVALADMVERISGIPTTVENDANAAAYGEFVAGAGKGCKNFIAITLGTGVGSGIIIDGKLISGASNAIGEMGHMVIEVDGAQCTCGRKGCFETYASATGLIRMTKEAMEKDKDSKLWELSNNGDHVSAKTSFIAMREGDKTAAEVVDKYIKYLAAGVANAVNIFAPDVICIGGGVCHEGDALMNPLKELVLKEQFGGSERGNTKICRAQLGNSAGIIGAAFLNK